MIQSVSYTHLDVYKRQVLVSYVGQRGARQTYIKLNSRSEQELHMACPERGAQLN